MLSDRCPVLCVLSVWTLVHCGQTVGRIKMKLGVQVGFGPGYVVFDEDPAPLPKGACPHPIFGPYLLRPNGCVDQDATWYGGRRLCVRWGPRSPPQKGGGAPKFSALVYYSYCDFVRTLHSSYWFVQVQLLVLYAFYF